MKKRERTGRLALTLLLVGFVFLLNTLALLLTIAAVYCLARLGVIAVTAGQVGLPDVLRLLLYTSLTFGILLAILGGKLSLRPLYRVVEKLDCLARGDFKARLHFGRPIGEHPAFRRMEQSFNRAAEELEHTQMLRADFINNFSHEFKTPIVSIAGFAKLLRRGNLTPAQQEEYLAVIEEESLRLSAMATNVLNLTKVENQTILTDVTEFNLSEQIRGAVLLLADQWTAKELELELQFDEQLICGSEELLKQVWINLLDNAVKFSPRGGRIEVTISPQGQWVLVTVANAGKEIPQESLAYIFNKFYQADESHSSEGNGIGLAVVKRVCELHRGQVAVESRPGRTAFTVTLPRSQR